MLKSLILGFVFFLIDKTCTWVFHDEDVLKSAEESRSPVLICLWHGLCIFPLIYLKQFAKKIKVVSSTHKDSLVLAKILKYYGFSLIKGSSSRGATGVIKEMIKSFKNSNSIIAITNDGPKGPLRIAKPGAINLAYKLNAKIIFVSGRSSRFWNLKTWDHFIIPKPFSVNHIYVKNITFDSFNDDEVSIDQFITTKMNDLQNKIDNDLI